MRRALERQSSPAGEFDASRYFRTTERLEFLNVRTPVVRALAKETARAHEHHWTIDDTIAFAETLLRDQRLEVKAAGVEALGCRRRELSPRFLGVVKRWLADDLAANWATTDTICGTLISPLLLAHPGLVPRVAAWARHPNLWVRRASAVSLVRLAARGVGLDDAYLVVRTLRSDSEDLIQKACGWLLREAGKADRARLERYLRTNGPATARTTVRYAIERFEPAERRRLLAVTKSSNR